MEKYHITLAIMMESLRICESIKVTFIIWFRYSDAVYWSSKSLQNFIKIQKFCRHHLPCIQFILDSVQRMLRPYLNRYWTHTSFQLISISNFLKKDTSTFFIYLFLCVAFVCYQSLFKTQLQMMTWKKCYNENNMC